MLGKDDWGGSSVTWTPLGIAKVHEASLAASCVARNLAFLLSFADTHFHILLAGRIGPAWCRVSVAFQKW